MWIPSRGAIFTEPAAMIIARLVQSAGCSLDRLTWEESKVIESTVQVLGDII